MKRNKKQEQNKNGKKTYRRLDISDAKWKLIKPHLTDQPGQHGGITKDNRKFINAVIWIVKIKPPWRDLSPDHGEWGMVHQRFIRWQQKGMWKKLFWLFSYLKATRNLNG